MSCSARARTGTGYAGSDAAGCCGFARRPICEWALNLKRLTRAQLQSV